MIPAAAHQPVRGALRALVLLAAFGAMLAVASPAGAASSCGRAVIDDWYDNGRVDGTYALHCYDDAIDILPRDVRDYSSAKDDIQRALQARKRGEAAPPATTDPTPGDETATTRDGRRRPTAPAPHARERARRRTAARERHRGGRRDRRRSDSASSVPIPLLILAGLALLLVAAGCAGYRGPPHPGAPPAAVDLELSRRPGGPGGYTTSTVSRFAKRLFVRFPASVRCWV